MTKLQGDCVSWLVYFTGAAQLLLVCGQSSLVGMFNFHDLSQFYYIYCMDAAVYLSLGSTNITTNNTEILITSIGDDAEGGLPSLTCHTDLTACCRRSDTMAEDPIGDWHFPNGDAIPVGQTTAPNVSFYVGRNKQVVRLCRRESREPQIPTGSYCCTVPTIEGEMTLCANLGE